MYIYRLTQHTLNEIQKNADNHFLKVLFICVLLINALHRNAFISIIVLE